MKVEIHSNHRLEVRPDTQFLPAIARTNDGLRRTLDEMKAAIERHVDGVGQVSLRWDTVHKCSYCGHAWETLTAEEAANPESRYDAESVEGEPSCCNDAVDEFRANRAEARHG